MKFYYNGKLVRTSKNHEYTHAVINADKEKLVGCRTSKEACQSLINSEINACKQSIQNCKNAIKAKQEGKNGYFAKYGRQSGKVYFYDGWNSIETFKGHIARQERQIEYIQNNYKIVELEMKEK